MIKTFRSEATEDIDNGRHSKRARKTLPTELWRIAGRKLDQLDSVVYLEELQIPPGNRFETLTGTRKGEFSIRINDQYRVCFKWSAEGPVDVEITDYHR
ncbi:MAG: type II toxin-antitoxin system RelE/ParE family toxin [Sediminispirochaetaceae bacterium]